MEVGTAEEFLGLSPEAKRFEKLLEKHFAWMDGRTTRRYAYQALLLAKRFPESVSSLRRWRPSPTV
jgi:hypothetical protein